MAVTLNASTTTGLVQSADTSGIITLQNNGTNAVTITSGNLQFNSGYGSVATAYGCRAWVNFDGTTNTGGFCTIRASGNVTTVADNGTGDYTINFTTAMPDANYSANGTNSGLGSLGEYSAGIISMTSSAVRMIAFKSGVGNADPTFFCAAVFR
jgi:hypothetical protein